MLFTFIGAQFIGMGLLGEYIGRIYTDVRARPRYFVQQDVYKRQGLELTVLDSQCCGIAGTYGFKKENYPTSQAIGCLLYTSRCV